MVRRDASISIELDAQTAKLERKIEDSTKDIQGLNASLLNTEAAMSLVTQAIDFLSAAFDAAIDTVTFFNDRLLRLADVGLDAIRTGLDPVTLEEWGRAARFAGVEADALTEASFELTKRLGEARAEGQGTAFEAFQGLGIDINQAFTPAELTDRVLRTLQQTRQGSQATADFLADELLGDLGRELIPLISQWDESLGRATERLGGLQGATEETFQQAELYRRELETTKNLFSDLADVISTALLPSLNALLIGFKAFADTAIISTRIEFERRQAQFRALREELNTPIGNLIDQAANISPLVAFARGPLAPFFRLRAAAGEAAELELERLQFLASQIPEPIPFLPSAARQPRSIGIATRERGGFAEASRLRKQQEELQRAQLRQLQRIGDNTEVLPQPADL